MGNSSADAIHTSTSRSYVLLPWSVHSRFTFVMISTSRANSEEKSASILSFASLISMACAHASSNVTGFAGSLSSPRRYSIRFKGSPVNRLWAIERAADTSSAAQRSRASCRSKGNGCTPACCHLANRSISISALIQAGLCVGVERIGSGASKESISTYSDKKYFSNVSTSEQLPLTLHDFSLVNVSP